MAYKSSDMFSFYAGSVHDDDMMERPHRLLGDILRDNGWITEGQMKAVLVEMGVERDLVSVE
jgi:hypothetical protein